MEHKVLRFMLFVSISVACFAQSTYFVTPTPDTPCPGDQEPCHTLSEYVAVGYFNNLPMNTTMQFLPGNHTLKTTITLANLTSLAVLGDSSSFSEVTSRIVCTWPAGFVFNNITELHITALAFLSCGHENVGAINITLVKESYVSKCAFITNYAAERYGYGGAIAAWYSSLSLAESTLQNNSAYYGGAIGTEYSTLNVTRNTFQDNFAYLGGVIALYGSFFSDTGNTAQHAGGTTAEGNLTTNVFQGNIANQGGAIFTQEAILSFTGNNFRTNSAGMGGAVVASGSTLDLTTNTFQGNSAFRGGAILTLEAILSITGNNFENNSAESEGGAIAADGGTINLLTNTFQGNSAFTGGAILTLEAILSITGNNFENNSAEEQGGAISAIGGTLNLTTNRLHDNSAIFGGATYADDITGRLTSNNFQNNSATMGAIITSNSRFTFINNVFQNNRATYGGANAALNATLNLSYNTFQNNFAYNGGALYVMVSSVVVLTGDIFYQNLAVSIGGAFAVYGGNLTFSSNIEGNNATSLRGGAVHQQNLVKVTIHSNGASYGGGLYMVTTTISGSMILTNNSAIIEGGAIFASGGMFLLSGTTTIASNLARIGGGLLISEDSKLYLASNTVVHLINNSALETGGAIHTKAIYQAELCHLMLLNFAATQFASDCFFQFEINITQLQAAKKSSKIQQFVQSLNVSLYFESNSAEDAGGDLYSGLIDHCLLRSIEGTTILYSNYPYSGFFFDGIFSSEKSLDITSDPMWLCICKQELQNCNITNYTESVYPGGTLEVPVIALGQRKQPTIAVVHTIDIFESMALRYYEYSQSISRGCNILRYTIQSRAVGTTQGMSLYADGPCSSDVKIAVSINIQHCPGFQLPQDESSCDCTEGLQSYTDICVVDNGTVLRKVNAEFWMGYHNDDGLIIHPHCPFDYCTSEETCLKVTCTNSDKQCNNNRSGLICGRCGEGLSLVMGSSRCLQCSNSYLSLTAAFALAGIALVLLLLLLRLTVAAGTINGLVFYANIVTMNSATFFRPRTTNVLTVFIAWLNLDLGIETCFYNGMDAYVKTWLQFVFPIYVWGIVGAMILGSHYSVRLVRLLGRNPVAVLATLFLLSYAKLLHTAIAALSYTTLQFPNSEIAVWLYDGNIEYLRSRHIPLFIAALSCLVFLFLPYTALLIFAQWVQAKSKWRVSSWINSRYIVPFLDAYHAPYSTKHRYWMGLMLLLRLVLFLISAVNALGDPRVNLMAVAAALTLTIPAIAGIGIYKSWYLGLLEISFLVNLAALVRATFIQMKLTKMLLHLPLSAQLFQPSLE